MDVALITLHGMGKVKPNYYKELEKKLKKKLGNDWEKVSFQNVQYAPILQDPEDELWEAMRRERNNDLNFSKLRKFLLFGFGDAGSVAYGAHRNKKQYIKVQQEIENALARAYIDFGATNKPVVIIAQSLGCQVISNYIWDAQNNKNLFENSLSGSENEQNFKKLKSCENLITTGCNIPLFNAGLAVRECFNKPNINTSFHWDNYYDADDVLGWPLKQLGVDYNELITDHEINAGGILSSWNPFSHGQYWGDNDIIYPLIKILKDKMVP